MIFGLDEFARAEFAHTIWHDIKNWIEFCNHLDVGWTELEAESSDWSPLCATPSNPWLKPAVDAAEWNKVEPDETDWTKIQPADSEITRC